MSVFEPPARLAVRNFEDLVGVVPYLIGFHPAESLVILVVEEGRVVVTARVDLVAMAESGALANLITRLFERFPAAEGWFLAYAEDAEAAWVMLGRCAELAGGLRLARVIHVGARCWRADDPTGPSGPVAVSPSAAQAAVMGLPVRASREELADQVAGPPDCDTDALVAEFEVAAIRIGLLNRQRRRRLLNRLLVCADTREDFVRLAVLVAEPAAQLAVLERLDRDNAVVATRLWTAVIGHCLVPYLVGPLGLLGLASWLAGDGALQTICLERLDRIDPLAPVAALLDWINVKVLPPTEWGAHRPILLGALMDQFEAIGQPAADTNW